MNWLIVSALGFGFLSFVVFLTSLIDDSLYGVKVVDNPIVKEILLRNYISKTTFVLVDCATTPVLDEAVYRGFLLSSLASSIKWLHAVVISTVIFSAAHFPVTILHSHIQCSSFFPVTILYSYSSQGACLDDLIVGRAT
ncbi:hypothetical protein Dsin_031448 [Dipteronia sinensis]|uniref:CAAX prenyl protease 2/Lysostaphin resistance protein A-like domain-containing protein n=1 Tax=Dipteronia sinensis TaxID=43782 RepID=A0AAD9ZLL5_9ROSI|nr:hypothetical protein Dsin_031448 [Dipteronia sinensis]